MTSVSCELAVPVTKSMCIKWIEESTGATEKSS